MAIGAEHPPSVAHNLVPVVILHLSFLRLFCVPYRDLIIAQKNHFCNRKTQKKIRIRKNIFENQSRSGICSLGYDQLAQINGINANIANGFAGVNSAICQLGYQNAQLVNGLERSVSNGDNAINLAIMQEGNARQAGQTALATQLASCCCENKQLIGDLKYTIATEDCATRQAIADNARAIVDNCNANFRSMMDYFTQDKIATLTAENQSLKFAASQDRQNALLTSAMSAAALAAARASGVALL